MIDPRIRAILCHRFPEKLADELLDCFREQRRNFLLGNLRPNEVDGGRFAEAAFRLLEHFAGWTVTPLGTHLDTEGLIRRLTNLPDGGFHESLRLHIPRTLRVIYDIRNKRDAAHLADGIDPNFQDSSFLSSAMDWILAELVRLSGGVSPDEAFKLVKGITVRRIPAVEDIDGFLKTLRPSLGPADRLLILLHHCADNGSTETELSGWLKPAQRRNIKRTLRQMEHQRDFVACVKGKFKITRRGIREIERRSLIEIE